MTLKTVCIDARMIASSGIGTYIQGLLAGIQEQGEPAFAYSLLGDPALIPKGPWTVHPVSSPIYSVREQLEIPWAVGRERGALLHAPHYNMPWLRAKETVVTVHDVIHLKFPQFWPSKIARAYAQLFFYHIVPRARAILTVSENTKRDLIELLSIAEDRITVTYPAVSHERYRDLSPASLAEFERLKLPEDYLLYVGNLKEFKNVQTLVQAYGVLRRRVTDCPWLVMVGRNFIPGFDRELLGTPGIRWLGEASTDALPRIYQKAVAFIYPSLYEGFGLPPLEAMASGTPVVCSDRASLPEVVGNAALLIDPESTEELAAAMRRIIEDGPLRKELSDKGLARAAAFSWGRMAKQTLRVYEQCLG